jgi:hypothetical protein
MHFESRVRSGLKVTAILLSDDSDLLLQQARARQYGFVVGHAGKSIASRQGGRKHERLPSNSSRSKILNARTNKPSALEFSRFGSGAILFSTKAKPVTHLAGNPSPAASYGACRGRTESLLASRGNSISRIKNSVKPQSKQSTTRGDKKT